MKKLKSRWRLIIHQIHVQSQFNIRIRNIDWIRNSPHIKCLKKIVPLNGEIIIRHDNHSWNIAIQCSY